MAEAQSTSKQYFMVLTILHGALLFGQLAFGIAAYYLVDSGQFGQDGAEILPVFQLMAPMMAVAGIFAGIFLSRKRIEAARGLTGLKAKLDEYRTAMIIKLALMEAPSMFAIVCFLLTGSQLFIGISGLILLVFILQRPVASKLMDDLQLSPEERAVLENGESVI